jgi:hypothetical protein
MDPSNTQRVEDNRVSDCQLVRRNDNLTGIADVRIQRQTKALVGDDALIVLASRLGGVAVARIGDWVFLGRDSFRASKQAHIT